MDKLLLSIYGSNSLTELKERAWLLLSYIESFIDRRYIVEERYNFLIDFLNSRSFEMRRCNRQVIYHFLNHLDGSLFIYL